MNIKKATWVIMDSAQALTSAVQTITGLSGQCPWETE